MSTAMKWYALQTRSNHEHILSSMLRYLGQEEFLPTYCCKQTHTHQKAREMERPLFPGYTFCRIDLRNGPKLYKLPGFIRVVAAGKTPIPLRDSEIEGIREITRSGVTIGPWPYLTTGDKLIVTHGPFRDLEGTFLFRKDAGYIVISLPLLQRSVAVTLDYSAVEPRLGLTRFASERGSPAPGTSGAGF